MGTARLHGVRLTGTQADLLLRLPQENTQALLEDKERVLHARVVVPRHLLARADLQLRDAKPRALGVVGRTLDVEEASCWMILFITTSSSTLRRRGEDERDHGSVLAVRSCPDASAVRLDDRPAHREAEAEPSFLVVKKASKIRVSCAGSNPTPESRTLTTTVPSASRAVSTCTSRRPPFPAAMASSALRTRFSTTCAICT